MKGYYPKVAAVTNVAPEDTEVFRALWGAFSREVARGRREKAEHFAGLLARLTHRAPKWRELDD